MAISVTPLHPHLGAEVAGVDLTQTVSPAAFAEIETAFHRYAVLGVSGPASQRRAADGVQPPVRPARDHADLHQRENGGGCTTPSSPTSRTSIPMER